MTMLREQVTPYNNMAVFYFRQAGVDVLFSRIGFRVSEDPVEVRRVGLVLPMVLEGMKVWCGRGGHRSNIGNH
jgi:hypothetical protein